MDPTRKWRSYADFVFRFDEPLPGDPPREKKLPSECDHSDVVTLFKEFKQNDGTEAECPTCGALCANLEPEKH